MKAGTDKLKALMGLASLINSSLDPLEIRGRAIEAATTLMDAETGSLLLVDRVTGELFFEVALGEKGELVKEVRLEQGEGIAGWVALKGEAVIVPDVQTDTRFSGKADKKSAYVTRSIIAAPLQVKGRTLGVLEAMNKRHGTFNDEDLELFMWLANLVAPAVENGYLYQQLKETFHGTALALAEALEKRDDYTGGHTRRVRDYTMAIAEHLGLGREQLDNLLLSAVLHDIGKIGVQDDILRKQGPLTREEAVVMEKHTSIGADILSFVHSLAGVVPGVLHHHERFDGSGYPGQIRGEDIHLNARIIAVADTFDAMTTDRPYRKALPVPVAMAELQKNSGTQFDPAIVKAFIATCDAAVEEEAIA